MVSNHNIVKNVIVGFKYLIQFELFCWYYFRMRQYLLINTMILPSFHDSGSCVIGLILASGSKQKLHHIANITIFPISKSKYVLKSKLENRFRITVNALPFTIPHHFKFPVKNAIWKNGPSFANGTLTSLMFNNHDENYLVQADRVMSWKCDTGFLLSKGFRSGFQREARERKKKHEDLTPDTRFIF